MQTEISYSPDTKRYDLIIDGLYHSQHECHVDAENAFDEFRAAQRKAKSVSLKLAELALAYGKARSEGRAEDAAQIKRQAMELQAAQLGIEYSVFEAEYQSYRAEQRAA